MAKFNFNQTEQLKKYCFEFLKSYLNLDYVYKTSGDVFQQRFETCKSCEFFNEAKIKCNECGCDLIVKMSDSLESCPVNKWGVDEKGFNERHYTEIVNSMPSEYWSYETSND
jgi:hypothetical protein